MNREVMDSILETVRNLPPEERVALADEVDRLVWRDRMLSLIERVTERDGNLPPLSDEEIDEIVNDERRETPLYEQYWIRRRRSAP